MAVKVECFEDNSRGSVADPELAAEVRAIRFFLCVCVSYVLVHLVILPHQPLALGSDWLSLQGYTEGYTAV